VAGDPVRAHRHRPAGGRSTGDGDDGDPAGAAQTSSKDDAKRLVAALGPRVETTAELEVVLADELVDEVDAIRLLFPVGDADLAVQHREPLDRLGVLLAEHPALVVRVEGHADSTGEKKGNRRLSDDRARAAID